ncbi:MAG: hypothetical protein JXA43_01330 [Candidatus Diapherotrites archaeon]|nr:hypothetical protein [Candidatus Diapherotrites archaeon]
MVDLKVPCILLFLVFLSVFVTADMHIVSPIDETVPNGATVFLGNVSPGQSFEIRVTPDITFGERQITVDKWDFVEILPSLPSDWETENSEISTSVLVAKVTVPKNAAAGQYYVKVRATDTGGDVIPSDATLTFTVLPGLTKPSLAAPLKTISQDDVAEFQVTILNTSIASDIVRIETDLPASWYTATSIPIKPSQNVTASLFVRPLGSGTKDFKIFVKSMNSGETVSSFNARIISNTTLSGALNSAKEGPMLYPAFELPIYSLVNLLFWWV